MNLDSGWGKRPDKEERQAKRAAKKEARQDKKEAKALAKEQKKQQEQQELVKEESKAKESLKKLGSEAETLQAAELIKLSKEGKTVDTLGNPITDEDLSKAKETLANAKAEDMIKLSPELMKAAYFEKATDGSWAFIAPKNSAAEKYIGAGLVFDEQYAAITDDQGNRRVGKLSAGHKPGYRFGNEMGELQYLVIYKGYHIETNVTEEEIKVCDASIEGKNADIINAKTEQDVLKQERADYASFLIDAQKYGRSIDRKGGGGDDYTTPFEIKDYSIDQKYLTNVANDLGVKPNILRSILMKESGSSRLWAQRFESNVRTGANYVKEMNELNLNDVERDYYSTSFGIVQIMGHHFDKLRNPDGSQMFKNPIDFVHWMQGDENQSAFERQMLAMKAYILSRDGLQEAMQRAGSEDATDADWIEIAKLYNGNQGGTLEDNKYAREAKEYFFQYENGELIMPEMSPIEDKVPEFYTGAELAAFQESIEGLSPRQKIMKAMEKMVADDTRGEHCYDWVERIYALAGVSRLKHRYFNGGQYKPGNPKFAPQNIVDNVQAGDWIYVHNGNDSDREGNHSVLVTKVLDPVNGIVEVISLPNGANRPAVRETYCLKDPAMSVASQYANVKRRPVTRASEVA